MYRDTTSDFRQGLFVHGVTGIPVSQQRPVSAVGVTAPPRNPRATVSLNSTQRWCRESAFFGATVVVWRLPISEAFLVFPRHTAGASLGARVGEIGFSIVHKSASVLTVFRTPSFKATV